MPCDIFAAFRFCCDTAGCVYESDDFSGTLAKWTQTAGSWSIVSAAVDTSDANAKLTCDTLHPTPTNKYIVSVTVRFTADGDVARVYVGDSAYYAELERITSICGRLRLYDGATCMGSVGVSLSTWTRIVVCSEEDKVHVSTGGLPMLTIPATVISSIVALGTAACTGTVSFEDFYLSKHYDDDNTCPSCGTEGCTWFRDDGCASGSLSATDWTVTGTWDYLNGIRCTADGTATVATTHPFASAKGAFSVSIPSPAGHPVGTTIRIGLDSSTSYLQYRVDSSGTWTATFWASGVQIGASKTLGASSIQLCYDGSTLTGFVVATGCTWRAPFTPGTFAPQIVVSSLGVGKTVAFSVSATKHVDDVATCPACVTPFCVACQDATFLPTVRVVIADATSVVYGCPCNTETLTLYATCSGCVWQTATDYRPSPGGCWPNPWRVTASVSAVTGGYKLSVMIEGVGLGTVWTALFENTVLGGLPDCSTAFDGDVPFVSWSDPGARSPCDFSTATCTFTSPAP